MAGEKTTVIRCPGCGGNIEWRAPGFSITLACALCGALVDASRPEAQFLLQSQKKVKFKPVIDLGTRGKWRGETYEVIGYMRRTDSSGDYHWSEYLLFNPYKGYRWLVENQGHWNDVVPLREKPQVSGNRAFYGGKYYDLYTDDAAKVAAVLGEFYWQVKVGDRVVAKDYVRAPEMLSCEKDASEEIWSLGTYVDSEEVAKAFSPKHHMPLKLGVAANQPSPHKKRGIMIAAILMSLLAIVIYLGSNIGDGPVYFNIALNPSTMPPGDTKIVTDFTLDPRPGNLILTTRETSAATPDPTFVVLRILNKQTNMERVTSVELPLNSSPKTQELEALPAGTYQLTIEKFIATKPLQNSYAISLAKGSGQSSNLFTAIFGLWLYPLWLKFRQWSFNSSRWVNSNVVGDE